MQTMKAYTDIEQSKELSICSADIEWLAEHFYKLGLRAQKGE